LCYQTTHNHASVETWQAFVDKSKVIVYHHTSVVFTKETLKMQWKPFSKEIQNSHFMNHEQMEQCLKLTKQWFSMQRMEWDTLNRCTIHFKRWVLLLTWLSCIDKFSSNILFWKVVCNIGNTTDFKWNILRLLTSKVIPFFEYYQMKKKVTSMQLEDFV